MSTAIELRGPADSRALIEPRGAALVGLQLLGADVIPDCANPAAAASFAGSTLAPWPNRIANGRWLHQGHPFQLSNVPGDGLGNALHGLVYDRVFSIPAQSPSSLTLTAEISASSEPGYPFDIRIEVEYSLSESSLRSTLSATNLGDSSAPVALGAHPYFAVPPGTTLTINAGQVGLDSAAMIPARRGSVTEIGLMAQRPSLVADLNLDHEFSDFIGDSGRATLTYSDGTQVHIEQDPGLGYQMIYTPQNFAWTHGTAPAIAIEPQTAAIDSLNNLLGLKTLQPGERLQVGWQVRVER